MFPEPVEKFVHCFDFYRRQLISSASAQTLDMKPSLNPTETNVHALLQLLQVFKTDYVPSLNFACKYAEGHTFESFISRAV